ncbi:MAG: hypothetical protein R6U43_03775 [Candidatus Krumholzibacteriales bacterium]
MNEYSRIPWRLSIILLAATLLYLPAISACPSIDDLYCLKLARFSSFNLLTASYSFYRPIELLINSINYSFFELRPYFSIGFNIALYLLNICLVFYLARAILRSRAAALLSALLYALHPANASSVIQIDAISQNSASSLALVSFYLLFISRRIIGRVRSPGSIALMFLLFFGILCSKESVLGLFGLYPLLFLYRLKREDRLTIRSCVPILAAWAAALSVYLLIRLHLEIPPFDHANIMAGAADDSYGLYLDLKTAIRNLFLLTGVTAYLGNSIDLFISTRPLRQISLAAGVILSTGTILPALAGAAGYIRSLMRKGNRSGERFLVFSLLLCFIAATFPIVITVDRVSELYGSLLTPFYSILLIFFAGRAVRTIPEGIKRYYLTLCLLLFLASSVYSITSKVFCYREVGKQSCQFIALLKEPPLSELSGEAGEVPVCLHGDKKPDDAPDQEYSIFYIHYPHIISPLRFHPFKRDLSIRFRYGGGPDCRYHIHVDDRELRFVEGD